MFKLLKLQSLVILIILPIFFLSAAKTGAAILLQEDFSDGIADNFTEYSTNSINKWNIVNGKYRGTIYKGNYSWIQSRAGDDTWRDYILEAEITGIEGVDRHLFFRYDLSRQHGRKGYALKFYDGAYGSVAELQKNGAGYLLHKAYFGSSLNNPNRVRIELYKNNIKVYRNDLLWVDYTDNDNPVLEGGIGLAVQPPGLSWATKTITDYDNILVTSIDSHPPLNLPISYPNRGTEGESGEDFQAAFWHRLTASFDHEFDEGLFINYLGEEYLPEDCDEDSTALECYDGHAGLDFSRFINKGISNEQDTSVYAAAPGKVVYRSEKFEKENGKSPVKCKPDARNLGCALILEHNIEDYPNLYTLYGHLYDIYPNDDEDIVDITNSIALMGATGKATGRHLHFSVFKGDPIVNTIGLNAFKQMSKNDWKALISKMNFDPADPLTSYCSYTAPNGWVFYPIDPNGWSGEGDDPWISSCGQENEYLWKYSIN